MRWWIFFIFVSHLVGAEIRTEISNRGYYEFENCKLSASWYDDFYAQFELLEEEYKKNGDFRELLDSADQKFGKSSQHGNYYMGMFLPARSRQLRLFFFRYCQDYRIFLEMNYPQLLEVQPLRNLFYKYEELLEIANEYFSMIFEALEKEGIPTLPAFLENREYLATVLKVVRYEPGLHSGLSPHYDTSGFSLLLDHTDEDEEALALAPYKENLHDSDLVRPQRQFSRGTSTSALLIPGVALKASGIPLDPTLHRVRPLEKTRYAVIAFAMIPKL